MSCGGGLAEDESVSIVHDDLCLYRNVWGRDDQCTRAIQLIQALKRCCPRCRSVMI